MYISATDIKTPQSKELQHTKIHKATLVIVFIVFLTQKNLDILWSSATKEKTFTKQLVGSLLMGISPQATQLFKEYIPWGLA